MVLTGVAARDSAGPGVAVGWSQYFVSLLTVVATLGIKLSSQFTAIMVAIKVAILLAVIGSVPSSSKLPIAARSSRRPSPSSRPPATSVMLILFLGQSRVPFAMSRDRLLPVGLAKVHSKWGTPYRISIGVGVVVTIFAGFIPLEALAELVHIGTLFAFLLVSVGVLRRTRLDLPRAFRVPLGPVLPALAVLACLFLMLDLTGETWLRFAVWMLAGFVVYFVYSARHSRLSPGGVTAPVEASTPQQGRRPAHEGSAIRGK